MRGVFKQTVTSERRQTAFSALSMFGLLSSTKFSNCVLVTNTNLVCIGMKESNKCDFSQNLFPSRMNDLISEGTISQ